MPENAGSVPVYTSTAGGFRPAREIAALRPTRAERKVSRKEVRAGVEPAPAVSGFRCTTPGCPVTELFPHAGALKAHQQAAHPEYPEASAITGWSDEILAERVKTAILSAGLSQAEVSRRMNLHPTTVYAIVSGKQRISVQQLMALSEITGVTVSTFLSLPDTPGQPVAVSPPALLPQSAGQLLDLLTDKIKFMEAELTALRAAAGDESAVAEKDELIAELKAEIKMYQSKMETMQRENVRARKLLGLGS